MRSQVMRIREIREAADMTQPQLAVAMGVTQSAVSNWETENFLPRAAQLPLLAKVLDCSIDELFVPEDEDPSMDQYTA